jgi:hypothetical protein
VGVSQIDVVNPNSTSTYTWSTPDGHIDLYNSPTSITVDSPGTYIVTQRLQSGCAVYATDTVVITTNPYCFVLQNSTDFKGRLSDNQALLNWSAPSNKGINYFEIEKGTDGLTFNSIGKINPKSSSEDITNYNLTDNVNVLTNPFIYYRLKTVGYNGQIAYSKIVKLYTGEKQGETIIITPNPVRDVMRLNISSSTRGSAELSIYDVAGRQMMSLPVSVQKENTMVEVNGFQSWPRGVYSVKVSLGNSLFVKRMVLIK